jgi:hypothetical protein
LLAGCRKWPEARKRGVDRDSEVARDSVQRLSPRYDQPVKRCEALQGDLPAERERRVLFRSVTKLHRGEMLRDGPETISDVIPIQLECLAAAIDASERNVDVGMFRVEVRHCHPFEGCVEVGLHAAHHVPREPLQIETFAELGGDNQFP